MPDFGLNRDFFGLSHAVRYPLWTPRFVTLLTEDHNRIAQSSANAPTFAAM